VRGISFYSKSILMSQLLQSAGHLRSLYLDFWSFGYNNADEAMEFASLGSALPALQVLSLSTVHADRMSAAAWRRFFSSLLVMHTLRLVRCHHVEILLPLLAECAPPLLRALHIRRKAEFYDPSREATAHAVQALQHALPQLRIEIH